MSAGIFLLTVLGAALVISSQRAGNNIYAASLKGTDSIWVSPPAEKKSHTSINVTDSSSNAGQFSGTYSPSDSSSTNAAENDFLSSTGSQFNEPIVLTPQPVKEAAETQDVNLLTSVSENNKEQPSVTARNNETKKAMDNTAKTAKTAAKKTPEVSATTSKAAPAEKKATAQKKQSQPATAAKTSKQAASSAATQYWVQVSSYSAKKNADEARSVLDSNNLPCEVFTHTKDGTMYYRVRVGPYSAKTEADKAKTKVDGISMFKSAGSYVVSSKKEN